MQQKSPASARRSGEFPRPPLAQKQAVRRRRYTVALAQEQAGAAACRTLECAGGTIIVPRVDSRNGVGVAPVSWTVFGLGRLGQVIASPFVFDGREIAQRRVAAGRIVEAFDELEDRHAGLRMGRIVSRGVV